VAGGDTLWSSAPFVNQGERVRRYQDDVGHPILIIFNIFASFYSRRPETFKPVATYPSAGGRRETRGMRVPRKEYARSRHQRLFEENVGKTGKDAIYELLSERLGSCIYARGRY